jgi:hypothetical protein
VTPRSNYRFELSVCGVAAWDRGIHFAIRDILVAACYVARLKMARSGFGEPITWRDSSRLVLSTRATVCAARRIYAFRLSASWRVSLTPLAHVLSRRRRCRTRAGDVRFLSLRLRASIAYFIAYFDVRILRDSRDARRAAHGGRAGPNRDFMRRERQRSGMRLAQTTL